MGGFYDEDEDEGTPVAGAVFDVETIPAEEWNAMVEKSARNRPLVLLALNEGNFRHPWNVRLSWNVEAEEWEADIKPGFVNGEETRARIAADRASLETLERLGVAGNRGESVEAYLSERPRLPLGAMRAIGTDDIAGASEPVPDYFRARGVGDPPRVEINLNAFTIETTLEDRSGLRLLRAADLVLTQSRPRLVLDWYLVGNLGFTFARFGVGVALPPEWSPQARVAFRPRHVEPAAPDPLGTLRGTWEDPGFDELTLATVYLLSPVGSPPGSDVGPEWSPYVRHHQFWNMGHAIPEPGKRGADTVITWPLGLAGGVADLSIFDLAARLNDESDAALQFLLSHRIKGEFWDV